MSYVPAMTPTVLICDNEAPLRALVRATLSGGKYTLVEATNGDEALSLARSTQPDLLVLDMMMPGRSGLDVLVELRADPELDQIAVVLLTARTLAADRAAAEAAGADYFLAKPFSPLELMRIVDDLLAARA
jgi:CheY-like chemotaxis protein